MKQVFNSYSKEAIKARMLKTAASLWGLKNQQTLDPFVALLIEAFSTEIFKVSNEVNNIETRILQKIASLLTPSIYTIPQPAHCIGWTHPLDSRYTLRRDAEFEYTIEIPAKAKGLPAKKVDMKFTPVDAVGLVNAGIAGIVTGYNCYCFDKELNKILLKRTRDIPVNYGEMWLAIELSDYEPEQLEKLPLYFSNTAFEHIDWLYSLLPYIDVTLEDISLEIQAGIEYENSQQLDGYEEIFNEFNVEKRVIDNIKNIYKQYFITLKGFPKQLQQYCRPFPEALQSWFQSPDVKAQFTGKYIWLKLKFHPRYTFDILEDFSVYINAFPMVNRKWKQIDYSFTITGNNIPLKLEEGEQFLFVDKVSDNAGVAYSEIPYAGTASMQRGLYSVRRGGLERFDERDAMDIVNYMMELSRDEVSAFGSAGIGNVLAPLKEMGTQLKKLNQIVSKNADAVKEIPTYVVTEPRLGVKQMTVSYWCTHCLLANDLRPFELLNAEKNTPVLKEKLLLLTHTRGGALPQKGADTVNAYRYALTAKDRLVTTQDIKNFCLYELRDVVKNVSTKKGVAISNKPKEGFIRTTDIFITVYNYDQFDEKYWKAREKELIQKIDARAIDGIHRRIFFINDTERS